MKINITILNEWLKDSIHITEIATYLNDIGFESYILGNYINIVIPPNREDCNSLYGIIRELSYKYNTDLNRLYLFNKVNITNNINIKITDYNFCPKYSGITITNINNNLNTPNYIIDELKEKNITPHSILVDIINYVMIITGQPLHAYDLNKIKKRICITKLKTDTKIKLLNGTLKNIKSNTYIISDNEKIISIPGIIGCYNSKIDKNTSTMFLESAFFNNKDITNMSNFYNIKTYSANEFVKQKDINVQILALNKVRELINKHIGGKYSNIITKQNKKFYPKNKKIKLYKENVKKLLGINIDNKIIYNILISLRIKIKSFKYYWALLIPLYRNDLMIEENIISNIIKYYGYKNIPYSKFNSNVTFKDYKINIINEIKSFMLYNGYMEVINYSFVSDILEKKYFTNKNFVYIQNPLSINMNIMRTSLFQGLIKTLNYNLNRGHKFIQLFELGNIFNKVNDNIKTESIISGICCEHKFYLHNKKVYKNSYFTIKNMIEKLCKIIFKSHAEFLNLLDNGIYEKYSTRLSINNQDIGSIGIVKEEFIQNISPKQKIYFFEIKFHNNILSDKVVFKNISKFPQVTRELSFIINNNIKFDDITKYIYNLEIKYLKKISLFDIYKDKRFNINNKSLTLSFMFSSIKKTLTDNEVNTQICIILDKLYKGFKIILRYL